LKVYWDKCFVPLTVFLLSLQGKHSNPNFWVCGRAFGAFWGTQSVDTLLFEKLKKKCLFGDVKAASK